MGNVKTLRPLVIVAMTLALTACGGDISEEDRQLADGGDLIDSSDMNDIMLNFADPDEAVNFFRTSLAKQPDNIEFQRGLAVSLANAKRHSEAVLIYEQIDEDGNATNEDRIAMADAYIRGGGWEEAQAQLNTIPPTFETYDRYRLEAIVADHNKDWAKADSFYDIARGLTTTPANVLNNWGYSKRIRGNYGEAEELFRRALRADPRLSTAKTNLVIVRALQGNFRLPVIPMTEAERAVLLYEMARIAVDDRNFDTARGLLQEAIDTHPLHFEPAVSALEALNTTPGI